MCDLVVFNVPKTHAHTHVGKVISAIGRAANVKVSDGTKMKYANAHDLRRSLGE